MSAAGAHIVDRLRAAVAAHSASPAIAASGEPAFTYGALWERARAIAAELGASPGVVAIYMEKSPELVAAMIGTWLAGAAFVPILPELPEARRTTILDETGATHAIVASDRVPPELRARCGIVDARARSPESARAPWASEARSRSTGGPESSSVEGPEGFVPTNIAVGQASAAVAPAGRVPSNTAGGGPSTADRAYIIYTSGSTGHPKGVVVPHRGLVNLLDAQIEAFDLQARDRCLWVLSPAFDASISDVFTALLAGATLHIEHPARLRAPSSLAAVLRQRSITHVDLPPSLLPLLPSCESPSLRTIIVGGEVCAPAAVRAWSSRVRLVNVYGPTEATVCSTLCVCDRTWSRPLIGRPLPNVELRIVDGELWIGGVGVADGYVASPELEAAKFVTLDGARWFRTGDRVVEHAGGEIEFLGRIDRQLKLHGVLVAPEEIEARLREHPAIADAAVALECRGHEPPRGVLVAYCQPRPGTETPSIARLRSHLSEMLDRRLVPRRIVLVDSFPRMSSGKVDFAALASLAASAREGGSIADSPATPGERTLAALWQQILGVDRISRRDRFFDLGGDSFAVIELIALAELAGLPLSVEDVYEAPQLSELARRADGSGRCATRSTARSCRELASDIAPLLATIDASLAKQRTSTRIAGEPRETGLLGDSVLPMAVDRRSAPQPKVAGDEARASGARSILLTGATGFLGSHVLAELAELSGRDASGRSITCLVRASDDAAARHRIAAALERIGRGELRARLDERVECVFGDLVAPRLGLGQWNELALRIDTIVHCAAEVSLARPYAELRAPNVEGTARVLELAASGRPKRLHVASTLSVFVGGERAGMLAEDDPLESAGYLYGGYAQSKWAAEWLVRQATSDAAIYRFGLLTGDTREGRSIDRDWLTWFVRGLAAVGAYPHVADELRVDVTPIDHAGRAMAKLVLDGARGTFHVANPRSATLSDVVAAVRRVGIELREVTRQDFAERVAALLDGDRVGDRRRLESLVGLLGMCRASDAYARVRACDVFQASGMSFDTRRTDAALAGSDIRCPPPGAALLDLYVERMLEDT